MVTRDFDAMLAEKANIRPTFKIGGQEFTLRAKLPYSRYNKLLAQMRSDETDPEQATVDFFQAVLIKADRQRFIELLNNDDEDDDNVIDLAQMDQLTDWIMEYFTGKLRNSSGSSSDGVNGTGPSQNVVSLNARTGTA